MPKLKPLGNSGVNVDIDKIIGYIPPWFWENIYPTKEAAEAAGKTVYAVANEETNTYYTTNPLNGSLSLITGLEKQTNVSDEDKALVKFTDFLGNEYELQKWVVDVLLPQISKNGKQKIVCCGNSNHTSYRDKLREKGVSSTEEFVYINFEHFPSQFFVYNTNVACVGSGNTYISMYNKQAIFAEFSKNIIWQTNASSRVPYLESVLKDLKYENSSTETAKEKEEERKSIPDEELELVSFSGKKIKAGLNFLRNHLSVWDFSNMFIESENMEEIPPEMFKNFPYVADVVTDPATNKITSIMRKTEDDVYHNKIKKMFGEYTGSKYTDLGLSSINEEEVEKYRKEMISVEDSLGHRGSLPLWMWKELLTEKDKECFVFSNLTNIDTIKTKFKGKPLMSINLERNGNEYSFLRLDDGKDMVESLYSINPIKDPAAIKYIVFKHGEIEPLFCLFGHDEVDYSIEKRKEYKDLNLVYKRAVSLYNKKRLEEIKAKKELEEVRKAFVELKSRLLNETKLSESFIFYSREEYEKSKSKLEEVCAPCAVYFNENNKSIDYVANAGYSNTNESKESFKLNDSILFDTIRGRISRFEKVFADIYRYKLALDEINFELENKFRGIKLNVTSVSVENSIQWDEPTQLKIVNENKDIVATVDLNQGGIEKLRKGLHETFGKYYAVNNNPPEFLKTINKQLKIRLVDSETEVQKSASLYDIISVKNTSKVWITNFKGYFLGPYDITNPSERSILIQTIDSLSETKIKSRNTMEKLKKEFFDFIKSNFGVIEVTTESSPDNIYETINFGLGKLAVLKTEYANPAGVEEFAMWFDTQKYYLDQRFSMYSSGMWLPKSILQLIPEAYQSVYGKLTIEDGAENNNSYGFGFDNFSKLFYFNKKNGELHCSFTVEELLIPSADTLEIIRNYFKTWEEEHTFIPDKYLFIPNEFRFLLDDESLKDYVVFDTTPNKESKPTRVEIAYNAINVFVKNNLVKTFKFHMFETDLSYFSEFKDQISTFKKIATIAESDGRIVAKRLVSKKVIDLTTQILLSLAKTKKDIPAIQKFLESANGRSIVGILASLVLKSSVRYFDPIYQHIIYDMSTEMRVAGETEIALETINFIQETFIKGLESTSPLVRVAVDSVAKEFDQPASSAEEEITFNYIPSDKLVN